jgi:hypothetical protein
VEEANYYDGGYSKGYVIEGDRQFQISHVRIDVKNGGNGICRVTVKAAPWSYPFAPLCGVVVERKANDPTQAMIRVREFTTKDYQDQRVDEPARPDSNPKDPGNAQAWADYRTAYAAWQNQDDTLGRKMFADADKYTQDVNLPEGWTKQTTVLQNGCCERAKAIKCDDDRGNNYAIQDTNHKEYGNTLSLWDSGNTESSDPNVEPIKAVSFCQAVRIVYAGACITSDGNGNANRGRFPRYLASITTGFNTWDTGNLTQPQYTSLASSYNPPPYEKKPADKAPPDQYQQYNRQDGQYNNQSGYPNGYSYNDQSGKR